MADFGLTLKYAFVFFEEGAYNSYRVGEGGVQTIGWRDDNFLFVIYDDRSEVANLNHARLITIEEANDGT